MNTTRRVVLVAMLAVALAGEATSADQPLAGAKPTLRRSASGQVCRVLTAGPELFCRCGIHSP